MVFQEISLFPTCRHVREMKSGKVWKTRDGIERNQNADTMPVHKKMIKKKIFFENDEINIFLTKYTRMHMNTHHHQPGTA